MTKSFHDKLLSAQKKIGTVAKDKTNPFFKSKYADINAIVEMVKPALNDEGLVLTQALSHIEGKPAIQTTISDGEAEISSITPLIENPDPQKMGAIITYFRRYALQSLLALQAEDDDGNSVVQPSYETVQSTPHPTQQGANKEQCNKCGAEMVFNPKTGKHFCSDRCWLK